MGGKEKDYGNCIICNKILGRTSKRCSSCSEIYYKIKHRNPNESEDELIRLTKEKRNILIKKDRDRNIINRYKGGSKPKYIKVVKLNK